MLINEVEKFRKEQIEVSRMCTTAGRPDLILGFLERKLTPAQAREELRPGAFTPAACARQVAHKICNSPQRRAFVQARKGNR